MELGAGDFKVIAAEVEVLESPGGELAAGRGRELRGVVLAQGLQGGVEGATQVAEVLEDEMPTAAAHDQVQGGGLSGGEKEGTRENG